MRHFDVDAITPNIVSTVQIGDSKNYIPKLISSSGARLLLLRRALGYSQNSWCKVIGIKQPSLSNIENGRTRMSISHALIVYDHTGVTPDWIYLGLEQGLPRKLSEAMAKLDRRPFQEAGLKRSDQVVTVVSCQTVRRQII